MAVAMLCDSDQISRHVSSAEARGRSIIGIR